MNARVQTDKLTSPDQMLWSVLLLGWVASYADRTVTGPRRRARLRHRDTRRSRRLRSAAER
jgi:hypothetical protein